MSGQPPPSEPAGSIPAPIEEPFGATPSTPPPPGSPGAPPPPPAERAPTRPADLGRRAGAGAIDAVLAFAVWAGLAEILSPGVWEAETTTRQQDEAVATALGASLVIWLVYSAICEWRWGQTLGMRICGTKVIKATGESLSFLEALLHVLLAIPDAIIAWFLIPLSRTRQRLGDRAAGALVIRSRAAVDITPSTADATGSPVGSPATSAPWGALWALLGLAIQLTLIVVIVIPFAIADPDLEDVGTTLGTQAMLALSMVAAAVIAASLSIRRRVTTRELGLGRSLANPFKWAAIGYVVYIVVAIVLAQLISPEQDDIAGDIGYGQGWLADVLTGLLIVVMAPVAEEIFFRGFLFAGIRKQAPFIVAAVVSAAIWGLFHYTGPDSWPVIAQLVAFGVVLAWVYEKTGSIRATIALHLINNAIAFTIIVTT